MQLPITVLVHIYNEEYSLIPWLLYHRRIFEHGIIVDYKSTDKSLLIIKAICPTWDIVDTRNEYFDAHDCDMEIMALETHITGYKITLNITEWLVFSTEFENSFLNDSTLRCIAIKPWAVCTNNENTDITVNDYIDSFRYVHKTYREGYRFLHNYLTLPYTVGRHQVETHFPFTTTHGTFLFWMGFFPWNTHIKNRRQQIKHKMSPADIKHGLGSQHLDTIEEMEKIRRVCISEHIDLFDDNKLNMAEVIDCLKK